MAKIITNGNASGHIDGTDHSDIINGEGGDDQIGGHQGDDTINGGSGDDHVHGGKGHDILTGGAGNDVFVFKEFASTDSDEVKDFKYDNKNNQAIDKIGIDSYYLTAFDGNIDKSEFRLGTQAQDNNDHLIYDKATGNLYYDVDGLGGEDQHLLATFDGSHGRHPKIVWDSFNFFDAP